MDKNFENALILAGGKSSRMGRDKTLLAYQNFPTITHFLFERLAKIFKSVKVAAKADKFAPKLPILLDNFDDFNPLNVIANLDKIYQKPVFIVPADTPFIKNETIEVLAARLNGGEISVAKSGKWTHFLCGFYAPSVSEKARNLLAQNCKKVGILAQVCNAKICEFDDWAQFFNINTPQDYEKIL